MWILAVVISIGTTVADIKAYPRPFDSEQSCKAQGIMTAQNIMEMKPPEVDGSLKFYCFNISEDV